LASHILKPVVAQVPVDRGPQSSSRDEEDDSIVRRQARRFVFCTDGLVSWRLNVVQVEAVGNHEVDERVAAGLVAGVLDCSRDEEGLRRADLRDVVRWPVGQVHWVAVRGEPPVEPDLWPTPQL